MSKSKITLLNILLIFCTMSVFSLGCDGGSSGTNPALLALLKTCKSDSLSWTARSASAASGWWGIAYGKGLFVAVGDSGTNRVMTSPDGITWTSRTAAEN
ncbi:hypothetical protein EHQ64_16635, partial [Leptospira sarikeiensis]